MPAMIDAQCPKCSKKFGWSGSMRNMPPCPRCQFRPPQAYLDAEQAKLDAYQERLRTHPGRASAETRRRQRIDAGFGLSVAAKLLGIKPSELAAYEHCRAEPSPELADMMAEVYGVEA